MEERAWPRLQICQLLVLRITSSDGWNIITAKLSQKSKLKLQLLAEMVIISTNPTTYPPIHPDKYEGDKIEQNIENKSFLSI